METPGTCCDGTAEVVGCSTLLCLMLGSLAPSQDPKAWRSIAWEVATSARCGTVEKRSPIGVAQHASFEGEFGHQEDHVRGLALPWDVQVHDSVLLSKQHCVLRVVETIPIIYYKSVTLCCLVWCTSAINVVCKLCGTANKYSNFYTDFVCLLEALLLCFS